MENFFRLFYVACRNDLFFLSVVPFTFGTICDAPRISPAKSMFNPIRCIYSPSITKTVDPTSPSFMIIEPAGNVTGCMQSTISRICVRSRFFMKSLSSMAALINSRDLETKKGSRWIFVRGTDISDTENIIDKYNRYNTISRTIVKLSRWEKISHDHSISRE